MDNINAILQKYANKGAASKPHSGATTQKPSVVRYDTQTTRLESQTRAVDKQLLKTQELLDSVRNSEQQRQSKYQFAQSAEKVVREPPEKQELLQDILSQETLKVATQEPPKPKIPEKPQPAAPKEEKPTDLVQIPRKELETLI